MKLRMLARLAFAGLGEALLQPVTDLVRRVCPASALIADYQRSPGRDPDHSGQTQQFPDGAHRLRLFVSASR